MRYVISDRALETIERECRKYPDTETGGIVVGFRDDDQTIVTHATGPGPNSQMSEHHFVKDTPYLQSVLNLLFQYYQVNYLGVWHKHPESMPFPSSGDLASAMEEVEDANVGLDELIAPICVMDSGAVQVLPFVIKERRYTRVSWDTVAHDELPSQGSVANQWYVTSVGHERLAKELSGFKEIGVPAQVRKGSDGTYRFYAPLAPTSPQRLVMLCYNDYPVSAPEVALYNEESKDIEPVVSQVAIDWGIDSSMSDIYKEYKLSAAEATGAGPQVRATSPDTRTVPIVRPPSPPVEQGRDYWGGCRVTLLRTPSPFHGL